MVSYFAYNQVQSSRLKYDDGAASIYGTGEIVVNSPLPSTSDDDEYDFCQKIL